MKIRATSGSAASLALIAIGWLLFRSLVAYATLEPAALNVLKQWITAEYRRYHLDRKDLSLEEKGAMLLQADKVEFLSVSARGSADSMVVRVEIKPSAVHPPRSPTLRYYRMKHSMILGWSLVSETSVVSYYTAPFL